MNKLMTTAGLLLLSSSAFASNITLQQDTQVSTASYTTEAQAIEAGQNLADNYNAMTQNELRFQLPVNSYQNVNNISVDNTQIKIEEFAAARGEVKYRAVVDVDYRFDAKETN